MTKTYGSLYISLQASLLACRELVPEKQIEACFQMAEHYCKELFHQAELGFAGKEDEIDYFRNVKPRFIAELLYWQLLNHFYIFCNPASPEYTDLVCREKNRLPDFLLHHRSFYHYYLSGNRELDKRYFTLSEEPVRYPLPLYFGGPQPSSGYDLVLASIMALKRYEDFIDRMMVSCKR